MSSIGNEGAAEHTGPWEGSLTYVIRIVTTLLLALLCWARFTEKETTLAVDTAFLVFLLAYPHLIHLAVRRRDRSVEVVANFADAFLLGLVIFHISFAFVPSAILFAIVTANAMALNGPRQILLVVFCVVAGSLLLGPFRGIDVQAVAGPATNGVVAVLLVLYFNLFAFLSYRRTRALKASRAELRQVAAQAGIEKGRNTEMLHNVLPPVAAAELKMLGRVKARRRENALMMVVTAIGLAAEADRRRPEDLVTALNLLLQSVDAILVRHGLTKVKTLTFGAFAAGNLDDHDESGLENLVAAALEIQQHLQGIVESNVDGPAPILASVALGSGAVTSGLIEADRFTFALWGEAVAEVMTLAGNIPRGEIWVTPSLAGLLSDQGHKVQPVRSGDDNSPFSIEVPTLVTAVDELG